MVTYFKSRINRNGVIKPLPGRGWGQFIFLMVVGLGLLLLLNLPGRNLSPSPDSTPVIVRDGLMVKGSGPELYLFKGFTIHQIINPTPDQQARAQRVDDAFLGQYTCGEPVDRTGRLFKEQSGQKSMALCPSHLPAAASPVSTLLTMLGWLGGVVGLAGGVWWLAQSLPQERSAGRPSLKTHVQQAADYTGQIEQILKTSPPQQRQPLLTQIHKWQQAIEELVQSLAALRENELIVRDVVSMPKIIADLEQRLAAENNPALRPQLEYMLIQRRNQLASLERLQTTIRQAEIQVEMTVTLLGTIYSQLLTQQSTFHVTDYQRLADNVDEEVQRLQDYLEALQEVKNPACFQLNYQ